MKSSTLSIIAGVTALVGTFLTADIAMASQQSVIRTNHQIWGTWKPIVRCDGCNPSGLWDGSGNDNIDARSIIKTGLQGGDSLRVLGLGGTVTASTGRYDCRTGSGPQTRVPMHTPLLQFLDAQGRVVHIPGGGYNQSNALRLLDMQMKNTFVPKSAVAVWASWPDTDYSQNGDLCYFTLEHITRTSAHAHIPVPKPTRQIRTHPKLLLEPEVAEHANMASIQSAEKSPLPAQVDSHTQVNQQLYIRESIPSSPKTERSKSYAERLICRVQSRYTEQHTSPIRKRRIIERLATHHGIKSSLVRDILQRPQYCASLWGKNAPYLFYAGTSELENKEAIPKIEPPATASAPSKIVRSTTYFSSRPSSTPKHSETKSSDNTREQNDLSETNDKSPDGDESAPLSEKLTILCRIQKRLQKESGGERDLEVTAESLADRWNMEASAIVQALENPDLCTMEAYVPPKDSGGEGVLAPLTKAAALSPLMLTVVVLAILTLLVLLLILFLPFEIEEEQKNKK